MARQFKFRIWSNETCYKLDNEKVEEYKGCWIIPSRIELGKDYKLFDLHHEDIVIEQFIGLVDDNGKEIYEGDILSWHEDGNEFEGEPSCYGEYIVKWSDDKLMFIFYDKYSNEAFEAGDTLYDRVIGNIHETQID